MSITLIGAGFSLNGYSEPVCRHGHARGAESLASYLWRQVGRPRISSSASLGRTRTLGRTGVLFFKNIEGFRGGLGDHVDLWDGSATMTGEYFNESKQTWFFETS